MDTKHLKKFAQSARNQLMEQVGVQLEKVLTTDSALLREKEKGLNELKKRLESLSKEQIIEEVAYTWFNRFCALRFMDVNRATRMGTVSPSAGFSQPEILAEAKQGYIDDDLEKFVDTKKVHDLLGGQLPSGDPQTEAYRLLLVAACNYYNSVMPFLFEKIADYTELLMPEDLLSEGSVISSIREALTVENCKDVEVIGWLYQYYISEKKDEVFADLKKNKKITPENIPAATQLFTPHWIVRYLLENSLGRLWMLNNPDSKLVEKMDYYIKPEQDETDFLKVDSPEEITVCDPACGSGHMLVYAFDLLYAIYEEEGYEPTDIPTKIFRNNLFGIEIDKRAGQLAAFALVMKALSYDKRFLSRNGKHRYAPQPNICVLENVHFTDEEIKRYMKEVAGDVFTADVIATLAQFEEADNFGSLIRPILKNPGEVIRKLRSLNMGLDIFTFTTTEKVVKALKQAVYLARKYHVVIANPPYMGGKGMNGNLGSWLKDNYADVKSDLFSAFIIRNIHFSLPKGQLGLMTPFVWMFLSSYEKLRRVILNENTLTNLVRPEYHAFFDSAYVPLCAFTLSSYHLHDHNGSFIDLNRFYGKDVQPIKTLEAINNPDCDWFFRASTDDFMKIPGSPIAYWISDIARNVFKSSTPVGSISKIRAGVATGNNERHVRLWFEVRLENLKLDASSRTEVWESSQNKWVLFNKGGIARKWYGNNDHVINFDRSSYKILKNSGNHLPSEEYYFKECLTWSDVTSGELCIRYFPKGSVFSTVGNSIFAEDIPLSIICCNLACNASTNWLQVLNPTFHANPGDVGKLPFEIPRHRNKVVGIFNNCVKLSKTDWDSHETSWEFSTLPLIYMANERKTLRQNFANLNDRCQQDILELQRLEEQNNKLFIDTFGLQDELLPVVPINKISLTCNPEYRFRGNKSKEEFDALHLNDTIKESISYSVGCMFGRYSLEKPGLILANRGETLQDYLIQVPKPSYPADEDNVIPILDGNWFTDDIAERFFKFLRVTFGDEHYDENLKFIEDAIGKDIRSYFLKDFYNNHVKMYKKRPIYWLFSSPKGSFNALIYMHRYRPDTVSVILNDYLREFRTKLIARRDNLDQVSISGSASKSEKTKALKEIEKLKKVINELDIYERDILYPLATEKIEIDLDDGVKVNYNKFGKALKKVTGLTGK